MKNPEREPTPTQVVLGIITNKQGQVLIIQRKKKEKAESAILNWAFPGGKIQKGEDKLSAVRREVLEETGYSVKIDKQISQRIHPQFPVQLHYLAAKIEDSQQSDYNQQEIEQVKWVDPKNLKDYFTTDLDQNVKNYLNIVSSET